MRNLLKTFITDEDGAITVDWVVLTALVLGIQILLILTPARNALVGVSESIGTEIDKYGEFLE